MREVAAITLRQDADGEEGAVGRGDNEAISRAKSMGYPDGSWKGRDRGMVDEMEVGWRRRADPCSWDISDRVADEAAPL
jgi:hypothetical protein